MKRFALLALIACFAGAQFAGTAVAAKSSSKPAKVKTSQDDGFSDGAN